MIDDDDDDDEDGWKILRPGVVLFETTIGLVYIFRKKVSICLREASSNLIQ